MSGFEFLTRYNTPYNKIRIGSDADGGYIIVDGLTYDELIACGISDDVTFENDFIQKYNVNCIAFDGTIDNLPQNSNKRIEWVKKNISRVSALNKTNLSEYIENKDNLFLKMDIELYEYQWLESITLENLNKFKQIVIEIHFPFSYLHEESVFSQTSYPNSMSIEEKINIINKINNTHYLVHLHPNSSCGTTTFNNTIVPNVIECTFLRKDLCPNATIDLSPIPNRSLDKPNSKYGQEITFNY